MLIVSIKLKIQLAFSTQKFKRSRDHGQAPFSKKLRGHIWTPPGNMFVKFEVRMFNCIGRK